MGKPTEPLVLHVNDAKEANADIARVLRAEGFRVAEAGSRSEALVLARQYRPRLIVLNDGNIAGDDTLYSLLKADQALAAIPLLVVAEHSDDLRENAAGYLLAPASAEEIAWQVRTLIRLSEREETLQQQKRHHKTLLNAFPGLVYYIDTEERYQFASQSYESWNEFAPQQIIGNRLRDTIGPGYPTIQPYLSRAWAGETVTFEATTERPDGPHVLRTQYLPELQDDDSPVGLLAVMTDITAEKEAAAALRESEEKFCALADTMPLLIWIADSAGQRTFFNKSWLAFTGRTLPQELGAGWTEGVHEEDLPQYQPAFEEALLTRQPFTAEYRLAFRDGTHRWILDNAVPRFTSGGEFKGFMGSCLDITERRQAEAEREQLLANERQARAEAEAANRAKEEFVSVLSHELRSPLNAICGWARLLQTKREQLDEPTLSRAISAIERSARLQAKIIENLLDAARLNTGKLELSSQPVELAQVIKSAVTAMTPNAEAGRITLDTQIAETVQVIADAPRLQQVLINLLSNAFKFTPTGGRVTVRLQRSGNNAQIKVEDTGQGISAEFLPHVFDHFAQTNTSGTRRHGGLGLGLTLVKQLTELHGGTVTADSAGEGKGATFTINLPLLQAGRAAESVSVAHDEEISLAGYKILVIDDEEDARSFMALLLKQHGMEVATADSAQSALQWLASQADAGTLPDLLISDISMPQRDGFMLLQELRTWPAERGGSLPAIALTALTQQEYRQKALQAGFQEHLAKPVQPELLLAALQRQIAKAKSVLQ